MLQNYWFYLEVNGLDWPIIIIVILAIFLFIKVISKLVRILIGVGILAAIVYFFLSLDLAMIMFL